MPAVPNLEDSMIVLNLAVVGALALGSLALVDPPPPPGPDTDDCRTATSAEATARVAADAATKLFTDAEKQAKTDIPTPPGPADVDESEITDTEQAELNRLKGEQLRLAELLDAAVVVRVAACTPPPAPAPKDEFDCADFPLPDGRTAQQVYDADKTDPNRLDEDGDGKACEAPADVSPPADCDTARELGIPLPIKAGDPRYAADLDDDRDNLACEVGEGKPASTPAPAPTVIVPGGAPNTGR